MRHSLPARRGVACAVLACVVGSLFTTFAQSQRPADQNQDRIVISKDEVLFDVVVRDKKGKLIKDLTLADFEVYEDGVKQNVDSFRFVSSTVAETAAAPAPSTDTSVRAGLPVEQIPAGNYELKITVSADGTSVSRSRSFTLVD